MPADLAALRAHLAEQVAVMSEAGDKVTTAADESVHDLRVAIARVRSALRTFGPALPDTSLELALRLKQCAAMLGPARDLEVIGDLLDSTDPGPLRDRELARVRAELSSRLELTRSEVSGATHARLVADLTSYVEGLGARAGGDLRPLARRAARRADKRFGAAGRDPDALHRARTAAKRARYAAEVVGRPKLARRLKRRTEGLGIHHDCHVAAARLLSTEVSGADADERDRILAHLEERAEDGRLTAIGSL